MEFTNSTRNLEIVLQHNLDSTVIGWLQEKIELICKTTSTKDLYLTYSLLASKIAPIETGVAQLGNNVLAIYLKSQKATTLEVGRIYLLSRVLEVNSSFFEPKVANIIQVADTGEMITFLKYLILLPNAENYKQVAVEALRTNIATVFDAISAHNHYPAAFFNEQQWNQMYLKAAFMERDLSAILQVDERANKELARIISDYAHERWAASRTIDPLFWRPVANFLDQALLNDMQRLLESTDSTENKAGGLCCFASKNVAAQELLNNYPDMLEQLQTGAVTWGIIKNNNGR